MLGMPMYMPSSEPITVRDSTLNAYDWVEPVQVDLPNARAGDLLLVFCGSYPFYLSPYTNAPGWTRISYENYYSAGDDYRQILQLYYKISDGTETTLPIECDSSSFGKLITNTYSLQNATGVVASDANIGESQTPATPAINTGWPDVPDTSMWFAAVSAGTDNATITQWPAGYGNFQYLNSNTGFYSNELGVCHRLRRSVTSESALSFQLSYLEQLAAGIFAVY